MKRIIICIMIIILAVPTYCQIQNTFFDCKLGGNVLRNQVKSNLEKLGYEYQEIKENGETKLFIYDSRYLGEHWDAIFIFFYKDIFYEISFWKMSDDEAFIEQNYELYKSVFMAKYSKWHMDKEYVVPRKSAKKTERFQDIENDIALVLEHIVFPIKDYETLTITYTDYKMADKKLWEEIGSW